MTRRASTDTPQIIMGAIGGVVTGYILWLAAISVGDGLTTVSQWSRVVLLLSVLVAVCGAAGGLRLRIRGKLAWSAFAFSLPIPPVVLTVAVLADIYL